MEKKIDFTEERMKLEEIRQDLKTLAMNFQYDQRIEYGRAILDISQRVAELEYEVLAKEAQAESIDGEKTT